MIDEGLYQLLCSSISIAALIGTQSSRQDGTSGIFGGQAPPSPILPIVIVEQIAGAPVMSMDGPDLARTARFQFTGRSKSRLGAKQLQRAIRKVLENFTGLLAEGTEIQHMHTVLEADSFEYAPYDYGAPLDVEITYVDSGS
ncbi:MAG TPA: hypothetical protein VGD60_00715 [Candidatus Acidoferrales bacterium]